MLQESITINKINNFKKQFSICSIITNMKEYDAMKYSFIQHGFQENTEYLIADNTIHNNFNAYEAINIFLQDATGEFIIIVHQDVRCIDFCNDLLTILDKLDKFDSNWAVCGNAGGNNYKELYYHLNNNGKIRKSHKLPAKVRSLDENFLVVKNRANIAVSSDLEGFHFYGTDICLVADFLGYTSYVIPFMVEHLSKGNLEELEKYKPIFIHNYGRKLRERFIQTTCTKFFLSNGTGKNKFYNSPVIFFLLKPVIRTLRSINRFFKQNGSF